MLIAIDYDGTYSADPEFWDVMIDLAIKHGHSVICATMRHESEGQEIISKLGRTIKIIFTGRKAKYQFLKDAGYSPTVWIDDSPYYLFKDAS